MIKRVFETNQFIQPILHFFQVKLSEFELHRPEDHRKRTGYVKKANAHQKILFQRVDGVLDDKSVIVRSVLSDSFVAHIPSC